MTGAPHPLKASKMERHENNYPIFEVKTEYPNGTNVIDFHRPKLPLYIRVALINLYDENCNLKRKHTTTSDKVLEDLVNRPDVLHAPNEIRIPLQQSLEKAIWYIEKLAELRQERERP